MEVTSIPNRKTEPLSNVCEVVNCCKEKLVANYKCPKCFIKYCSINCWKSHSKSECEKLSEPGLVIEIDTTGTTHSNLFPADDTIHPEHFEKFKYDKKIKKMLENPSLRQIIEEVDKARNVRTIMQQAMMEPIFVEFADRCLLLVNLEDHANESEEYCSD